ncbi:DNA polymerase delta small subunit [Guillardia theta CCMP2712]|uniref:DNA polymerase delta small subunit n=1 Tax=Guillardia theta (strain CCMP2712) TaxID=905079 RepID=L1JIW9_GUITC|nr:DNA polymerase delta small subunit [Guillardia theta CCMP2712]EKX48257.1 DNA polymerase delta small subunit [Guillardia theta CCMP2712]|eukprot:XP_005835237.1 DNA polymerase delta small subunit [Guillardia theta CCMP2712]
MDDEKLLYNECDIIFQLDRTDIDCDFSTKFVTQQKSLAAQYADVYYLRLMTLKHGLLDEARSKCKVYKPANRILDLEVGQKSMIVGTLLKVMKFRPNILDEFNKDVENISNESFKRNHYSSDDDYVIMEDESGRVNLRFPEDNNMARMLVTGVILAAYGQLGEDGTFQVDELQNPGLPPQIPTAGKMEGEPKIILVSGLELGNPDSDPLAVDMLVDYITGNLGGVETFQESAKVAKVIIAGSSCFFSSENRSSALYRKADPSQTRANQKETANPVRELDLLLTRLSSSVAVDILPGAGDPSNVFMPQQPFHNCLLPSANTYSSFRPTTNPCAKEEGVIIIGTSGQNVEDIQRCSEVEDPLDVMQNLLQWRHLAPTAPDTLPCFPVKDEDPFILPHCPHIFFAGNQKTFGSRTIDGEKGQKSLLVSVPSFSRTKTAVEVDVRTLTATPISFGTEAFHQD